MMSRLETNIFREQFEFFIVRMIRYQALLSRGFGFERNTSTNFCGFAEFETVNNREWGLFLGKYLICAINKSCALVSPTKRHSVASSANAVLFECSCSVPRAESGLFVDVTSTQLRWTWNSKGHCLTLS